MSALDLSGKSILVVDDVKFSRVTLTTLLGHMGHPITYHASNGREAINRLAKGGIDFVIADFNMPIMHGLQLLRAIRMGSEGIARNMPVAMVTGYSEKFLVDSALALDINAFLIKPVSKQGLERRLDRMLEQIHADDWLKPSDVYKSIDVDDALDLEEDIGHDNDGAIRARGIMLRTEVPTPPKKPGRKFKEEEIRGGDSPSEPDLMKDAAMSDQAGFDADSTPVNINDAHRCSIQQVPDHAILAQDIYTSDGRKYMHAGEVLTPRFISLLMDLHELGHPVEYVWIAK